MVSRISLGKNLKKPRQLETWQTGRVLHAIGDGTWRERIQRIRSLPSGSPVRTEEKKKLPYVTFAGEFNCRNGRNLIRHAGQLGIDLDDLEIDMAHQVKHIAVDDPHCIAAFFSASGTGIRLLIRTPPVTASEHRTLFRAVADYVRTRYGVDPDPSGSDVARACFVSWDGGIWINPQATVLPVELPKIGEIVHSNPRSLCTSDRWKEHWWLWIVRDCMPTLYKPDGTALTHRVLLNLAKRLATGARHQKYPVALNEFEIAAEVWVDEARKRNIRLRGDKNEYRAELLAMVKTAITSEWLDHSLETWPRWTKCEGFPSGPDDRIMFAIQKHCEARGTHDFFISVRDAARVAGCSPSNAAAILKDLVKAGILRDITPSVRPARHAKTYRWKMEATR